MNTPAPAGGPPTPGKARRSILVTEPCQDPVTQQGLWDGAPIATAGPHGSVHLQGSGGHMEGGRTDIPGVVLFLGLLGLIGCGLFPFSPNEVRLDESEKNLTRKNLKKLERVRPTDTFRIAVLGDSHFWETEARDAVRDLNRRDDITFAIHVGDITHIGLAKEYRWLNEFYSTLDIPFLTVIGNHDQLANGKAIYRAMYGPTDYVFQFGRTRFVFLDNNAREYDYDGETPDLEFLAEALPGDGSYDRAVVVSHVPPWDKDTDPELTPRFADILQQGGAVLSLHGHVHEFVDTFPFGDGVRYVSADALLGRNYLVISIGPEGIVVEQVFY